MTRTSSFAALLLVGIATSAGLASQQFGNRPRVSPHETHAFDVNGCHITITYGRPSKKGRMIWGTLVPWGRWWMPGADEATTVTTSEALSIGGLKMPAGEHTLYMWPEASASKLIISNETGQFHTQYHQNLDLGRVDYTLKRLPESIEQLTYTAETTADGHGALRLIWDDREYSVTFDVVKKGA
jgi:hypothetical protein